MQNFASGEAEFCCENVHSTDITSFAQQSGRSSACFPGEIIESMVVSLPKELLKVFAFQSLTFTPLRKPLRLFSRTQPLREVSNSVFQVQG